MQSYNKFGNIRRMITVSLRKCLSLVQSYILNQTNKYMRGKRERPVSIFLFTSSYLYIHTDHRKKKNEAKE